MPPTLPSLTRQPDRLLADPRRVVARPFIPTDPARVRAIVERVLALPPAEAAARLADVRARYAYRHRDFEAILQRHFALVAYHVPPDAALTEAQERLLGATFTHEYSIEAAALFNPSIVPHPDQRAVEAGAARVIVSFRATGEGHISSLTFRSGTLSTGGELHFDPAPRFATLPALSPEGAFCFAPDVPLAERVLFPATPDERSGIEDVRWVRFVEEDGAVTFYGSYTAFDGLHIRPKLLATQDFGAFRPVPLVGAAVANKGFALFPRRVGGQYVMLGRQDNEQNFVMLSDDLHRWEQAQLLRGPGSAREVVQIGNNGSPIETARGWLVLTHGVGPMREYTLGADLLALDDPTRVVATLPGALLAPDETEREGYVPNVLYTCGALLHEGWLVIPYAMSDAACGVARVRLDELLDAMVSGE